MTALIVAVSAGSALAAVMNGDGTLVGTNGNDVITAGNGNDHVYGLLGADTITAGNGNDVLDGDGSCGYSMGKYYCQDQQDQGDQGDNMTGGSGNDVVYGGGGPNIITLGNGVDTVYGGPVHDIITVGTGTGNQVYLALPGTAGYKGSTVTIARGAMAITTVHAQNGVKDTINCNNTKGKIYADRIDLTVNCPNVVYTTDPNPGPNPRLARRLTKHKLTTHKRTTHRHTHKRVVRR